MWEFGTPHLMLLNDNNYMICLKVLLILASQSTQVKHRFPQPRPEAGRPCLRAMSVDIDVTVIAASETIYQQHRWKHTFTQLHLSAWLLIGGDDVNTAHYGVTDSLLHHLNNKTLREEPKNSSIAPIKWVMEFRILACLFPFSSSFSEDNSPTRWQMCRVNVISCSKERFCTFPKVPQPF